MGKEMGCSTKQPLWMDECRNHARSDAKMQASNCRHCIQRLVLMVPQGFSLGAMHAWERREETGEGACHVNAPLAKITRVSRSETDQACSDNASSSVNGATINDGKATGSEGRMKTHVECTLF